MTVQVCTYAHPTSESAHLACTGSWHNACGGIGRSELVSWQGGASIAAETVTIPCQPQYRNGRNGRNGHDSVSATIPERPERPERSRFCAATIPERPGTAVPLIVDHPHSKKNRGDETRCWFDRDFCGLKRFPLDLFPLAVNGLNRLICLLVDVLHGLLGLQSQCEPHEQGHVVVKAYLTLR